MKLLFASVSVSLAAPLFAVTAPVIGDVAMTQRPDRKVEITYTLSDAPAIVTVDVQTNRGDGTFVSIGGKALRNLVGHVSEVIQPGAATRTVFWNPRTDWPEQTKDIADGNVRAVVTAWATNMPPDYLVVNLADKNESLKYYPGEDFLPLGIESDFYRTNSLVMRKIPASGIKWRMGKASNPRQVVLTKDFYMAVFEMTCGHCKAAGIPSGSWAGFTPWSSSLRPVFYEKYSDVRGTSTVMSEVASESRIGTLRATYGLPFDLPTSAEWEFACRAGCGADRYDGSSGDDTSLATLGRLARYNDNSGFKGGEGQSASDLAKMESFDQFTARAGSYLPNAFGLYDMLGNASEWCRDYLYADAVAADGVEIDPVGDDPEHAKVEGTDSKCRVVRGGSWNAWSSQMTSSFGYSKFTPENSTDVYTSHIFGIGYRLIMAIPGR